MDIAGRGSDHQREGKMENWAGKSETPWYAYREAVSLHGSGGRGVENNGAYAFYGCGSLENVVCRKGMPSGQYAFQGLQQIKESGCGRDLEKGFL